MDASLSNLVESTLGLANSASSVNLANPDDDYNAQFTAAIEAIEQADAIADAIHRAPYDSDRVAVLVKYVDQQQHINRKLYDLLVNMNNVFADKLQ